MDTEDKKKKIKKSLQQKIASAQLRLNRLQHKSKVEAKQIETRQKIILGAEVAKAVDS
ncbi:conjugal transfer protein TraD, partial [Klebsiella pneumoniae]